jgi:hypothetical protein
MNGKIRPRKVQQVMQSLTKDFMEEFPHVEMIANQTEIFHKKEL